MSDHRWYAIQTTAGHENKVRSLIERRIKDDPRGDEEKPISAPGSGLVLSDDDEDGMVLGTGSDLTLGAGGSAGLPTAADSSVHQRPAWPLSPSDGTGSRLWRSHPRWRSPA